MIGFFVWLYLDATLAFVINNQLSEGMMKEVVDVAVQAVRVSSTVPPESVDDQDMGT